MISHERDGKRSDPVQVLHLVQMQFHDGREIIFLGYASGKTAAILYAGQRYGWAGRIAVTRVAP